MTDARMFEWDGKTYVQANHPETSYDAANAAVPQAKTDEAMCYRMILKAGVVGMTADEISAVVESYDGRIFPPNQVNSRLQTLRDRGLIIRGEKDDTRPTRRNRQARVHYERTKMRESAE